MKVAIIGPAGLRCGIGTYLVALADELQELCDLKIFAHYGGNLEGPIYCWDRNDFPHFKLIDEINKFKPDVIHCQHEFGYFPKAAQFSSLMSYFRWKGYKTVTTLHSTYSNHYDKTVTEASAGQIIVHTQSAKDVLANKGINSDKITIIPHGSKFLTNDETLLPELFDTWRNPHTVFSSGFLFGYKNFSGALDVIAALKDKYPNIHYIINGSENPSCMNEHDKVYKEIMEKAEKMNLLSNLTLNRGFISEKALLSFIRTVKCCLLPYRNDPVSAVHATSGMGRLFIGTETPLVVSSAYLFEDINHIALVGDNTDELANQIDKIFQHKIDFDQMKKDRINFLKETSWKRTAEKTIDLYHSL
jgi:glycosyltransferase involved in cell wall biosynthesis